MLSSPIQIDIKTITSKDDFLIPMLIPLLSVLPSVYLQCLIPPAQMSS